MPDIWMDVDTAVGKVPVNIMPLIDDSDFKSRETLITYDQAGMDLVWNFVTSNGVFSQTAVTPTSGGLHDWVHRGDGMYSIEIPTSGGDINNTTEGTGWFTGICTGVLAWRGPMIGFRAAGLNNLLIDTSYSATRGLSGTALPNAAADAAGGLPISDAGGLDMDAIFANIGTSLVLGAGDVGDFKEDGDVHFFWNTIDRSGASVAPSTAGTLRVYKDDGTGQVTAPTGITDTRAFDGVTGLQECKVDTSANSFYAKEKNYFVVLAGAVIDTKTVNAVIASFSIENRWANVHFHYGGK